MVAYGPVAWTVDEGPIHVYLIHANGVWQSSGSKNQRSFSKVWWSQAVTTTSPKDAAPRHRATCKQSSSNLQVRVPSTLVFCWRNLKSILAYEQAFLAVSPQKRVVGFLVVEQITQAFPIVPTHSRKVLPSPPRPNPLTPR
jgi:hypothetical protein